MTTIDQRILIPASPDVVWAYISSIERNREWRVDHQDLTFITTFRKGQGARWRYTNGSRQEYVAEITAWYERMGYEYHIVDGGPFKTNRGRIRLQEIAEGTIIQWTFNYEIGGLLGGMRDAIGVRRSIENIIVDSLWALWRNIGQDEKARAESYTPKMLMREAPDVQSRANYTPRHPSVFRHGGPAPTTTAAPESSVLQQQVQQSEPPPATSEPAPPAPAASLPIVEPPVSDEDTRPRPSVAASQEPPPATQPPAEEPAAEREPDFLRDLVPAGDPQQPPSEADNVFKPPQAEPAQPEPAPTVEASAPEPEMPAASLEAETPPQDEPPAPASEASAPESEPTASVDSDTGPRTDLSDTASVSIFELFGVPRPSDAQTSDVASVEPAPETTAEPATEAEPEDAPQAPDDPVAEPAAEPAETPEPADEPVAESATEPEAQVEATPTEEPPSAVEAAPVAITPQPPATPVEVQAEASPQAASPTPIVIAGELSGRVGLRLRLRRGQVRLRQPGLPR